MKVNNKNSVFSNSPIIIGDNNKININGSSSDIEWKVLEDELIKVLGKLPKDSEEYVATKKLFAHTITENKKGIIDFLRTNKDKFATDVFTGVASGLLVEILRQLI